MYEHRANYTRLAIVISGVNITTSDSASYQRQKLAYWFLCECIHTMCPILYQQQKFQYLFWLTYSGWNQNQNINIIPKNYTIYLYKKSQGKGNAFIKIKCGSYHIPWIFRKKVVQFNGNRKLWNIFLWTSGTFLETVIHWVAKKQAKKSTWNQTWKKKLDQNRCYNLISMESYQTDSCHHVKASFHILI